MLVRSYYHIHSLYKNILPVKIHYVNILRSCSTSVPESVFKYNEVDQSHVLQTINENDTDELSRFRISKARLKKLDQWRTRKGRFESLDDVLEVDGFGVKVLENFYDSILDTRDNKITKQSKKTQGVLVKMSNFITPSEIISENISEVVAIHIGISAVSWCVVKRVGIQMSVNHWGLHDFTKDKRSNILQILQLANTVSNLIPRGDLYVFETLHTNMPSAASNQKAYVASTEKVQLMSMISALLASRKPKESLDYNSYENLEEFGNITYDSDESKSANYGVYYLRNMLPSRLYKTVVGSERISTQAVIQEIFVNSDKISSGKSTDDKNPVILKPLVNLYNSANSIHKESFGNSLLLGLACVRVCILKDEECIKKVLYR